MSGEHDAARWFGGAMSGTSGDGVDAVVVRIVGRGMEMEATLAGRGHRAYSPALREAVHRIREGGVVALRELAEVGRAMSMAYVAAIRLALGQAGRRGADLAAAAAHGQTLYHAPPHTIQWFDPALVAAEVGCAVVSDFRRADCAAGGQGAPLVPFADFILFRHPTRDRVMLNLGGIANITFLRAGGEIDRLDAFDTGPANCILDHLCRRRDPSGGGFDVEGRLAARGKVLTDVVEATCADAYFSTPAPKSTDVPAMIAAFESALRTAGVDAPDRPAALEDLLATACAITVRTIRAAVQAVSDQAGASLATLEIIASGGGVRNRHLLATLAAQWPPHVKTSDEWGIPAETKEALSFAILAAATLDGIPANVPAATGAVRPVVLGAITPAP